MQRVLVITAEKDATIEYFLSSLSEEDRLDVVHYKTDRPDLNQLVLSPTNDHKLELHTDGQIYNEMDFKSIYYRRTIPPKFNFQPPDFRLEIYCEEEYIRFLESLEYCFPETVKWFPGKPSDINRAKNKLLQLKLAQSLGLAIPVTSMTNRPEVLLSFEPPAIYKTIKSPNVPVGDRGRSAAWTTEIDESIRQHADGLLTCPGIIQKRACSLVDKLDIRVTVIGISVFAAENSSPKHVDGRLTSAPYRAHLLPTWLSDRLSKLVNSLSLNFGAIDLIYDLSSGKYWFIELNSNGQWAFIEEDTSLPLCAAVRNFLWK